MWLKSAILSYVACPALKHFSTLTHKRHDFRGFGGGGVTEYEIVLISSTTFILNISHSKKN